MHDSTSFHARRTRPRDARASASGQDGSNVVVAPRDQRALDTYAAAPPQRSQPSTSSHRTGPLHPALQQQQPPLTNVPRPPGPRKRRPGGGESQLIPRVTGNRADRTWAQAGAVYSAFNVSHPYPPMTTAQRPVGPNTPVDLTNSSPPLLGSPDLLRPTVHRSVPKLVPTHRPPSSPSTSSHSRSFGKTFSPFASSSPPRKPSLGGGSTKGWSSLLRPHPLHSLRSPPPSSSPSSGAYETAPEPSSEHRALRSRRSLSQRLGPLAQGLTHSRPLGAVENKGEGKRDRKAMGVFRWLGSSPAAQVAPSPWGGSEKLLLAGSSSTPIHFPPPLSPPPPPPPPSYSTPPSAGRAQPQGTTRSSPGVQHPQPNLRSTHQDSPSPQKPQGSDPRSSHPVSPSPTTTPSLPPTSPSSPHPMVRGASRIQDSAPPALPAKDPPRPVVQHGTSGPTHPPWHTPGDSMQEAHQDAASDDDSNVAIVRLSFQSPSE